MEASIRLIFVLLTVDLIVKAQKDLVFKAQNYLLQDHKQNFIMVESGYLSVTPTGFEYEHY